MLADTPAGLRLILFPCAAFQTVARVNLVEEHCPSVGMLHVAMQCRLIYCRLYTIIRVIKVSVVLFISPN